MEKKTMPVLVPDFYDEFHCVAADCRANCCDYPWRIYINKNNYKLLRSLKRPKWLTENFTHYIKRCETGVNNSQYAAVQHDEQGCVFQTKDGLCRIHAELGSEYLSNTCRDYPRIKNYLLVSDTGNMQMERSLAISCEEVSRILLQKHEPIQFRLGEATYSSSTFLGEERFATNHLEINNDRPILEHYNLVRSIGVAVLQNRDYTIEQRLMLLVVYLDKLAQAEASKEAAFIPAMTDTFVKAVDERLYDGLFAAKAAPEVTAALSNFAALYAFDGAGNIAIVKQCLANITSIDYATRNTNYYEFIKDKEYFMEHLLVMEFFGKVLPFTNTRSISDCIQYIVSIFTIFRFMLGGYLGEQTQLPENEFIDFVAYFGKEVLHTTSSFDSNIKLLQNNGMNTLPYLLSIVMG